MGSFQKTSWRSPFLHPSWMRKRNRSADILTSDSTVNFSETESRQDISVQNDNGAERKGDKGESYSPESMTRTAADRIPSDEPISEAMRFDGLRRASSERFTRLSKFGLLLVKWRRPVMVMWMAGGLGAVVLVFSVLYLHESGNHRSSVRYRCREAADLFTTYFTDSVNQTGVLGSYVSMMLQSSEVQQVDYALLRSFGQLTTQYRPFTEKVFYIEYVPRKDRAAFEARHNASITEWQGGVLIESHDHPVYAPVVFTSPIEGSEHFMYHDVGQECVNGMDYITYAVDSGEMSLSSSCSFSSVDLIMSFYPVYKNALPTNATVEMRRDAVHGLISATYKIKAMMDRIVLTRTLKTLRFRILESVGLSLPPVLLYESEAAAGSQSGRGWFVMPLNLAGQAKYEIWCKCETPFFFPWQPMTWAVAALVIVVLSTFIFHATSKRLEAVEVEYHNMEVINEQMEVTKTLAEQASNAKGAFLATVSHEIRTPLNGMIGMLNLLGKTKLDAVQMDYVETANMSGQALCELINDVLDLSKIEAGRMDLESIPFSPRDEVDAVLSLFGEKSREKGIELSAIVQMAVPNVVVGDPLRLRQILINLVGNAFKFTEEGHVFICVRLAQTNESDNIQQLSRGYPLGESRRPSSVSMMRKQNQSTVTAGESHQCTCGIALAGSGSSLAPGAAPTWDPGRMMSVSGREGLEYCNHWSRIHSIMESSSHACSCQPQQQQQLVPGSIARIVFSVEDSGVGISPEAQKHLFKPFVQADASTTRMHGGTGIGLCISKRLVNLMDGDITFVSRPKVGTTFVFDVRLAVGEPAERSSSPGAPTRTRQVAAQDPRQLIGLRVLYVDDRYLRCQVSAAYVRRLRMSVHVVDSLDAAAAELERVANSTRGGASDLAVSSDEMDDHTSSSSYDAVIIDGEALGRQGTLGEVRRRLGSRLPEGSLMPPLVLASQSIKEEVELEAKASGFKGILLKPWRKNALAACMLQLLQKSSRTGEPQSLVARSLSESRVVTLNYSTLLTLALRGRRFAVVDDNPVNRKVIGKMLGRYEVEVLLMSSGVQAVQELKPPHNVECILMDVQMPEMDGYETTRLIRKMESEQPGTVRVPIIALTADVLKETKIRCTESGMDSFMSKPVDEEQLFKILTQFFTSLPPSEQLPVESSDASTPL